MAVIQFRNGSYIDFDPDKMHIAELAIVTSDDPTTRTGKSIRVCFAPGDVQKFITEEEMDSAISEAIIVELGDDIERYVSEYMDEHPVSASVRSVNGKTGTVVLDASDVGAYVKPNGGIPKADLEQSVAGKIDDSYTKPSAGIPKTDLASGVQASLDRADSAVQSLDNYYTKSEVYGMLGAIQITSFGQYSGNTGSQVSAQGSGSFNITISSDPNAQDFIIIPRNTGWGIVSGITRSGTSVTISMTNVSSGAHTLSAGIYVLGYKRV